MIYRKHENSHFAIDGNKVMTVLVNTETNNCLLSVATVSEDTRQNLLEFTQSSAAEVEAQFEKIKLLSGGFKILQ